MCLTKATCAHRTAVATASVGIPLGVALLAALGGVWFFSRRRGDARRGSDERVGLTTAGYRGSHDDKDASAGQRWMKIHMGTTWREERRPMVELSSRPQEAQELASS